MNTAWLTLTNQRRKEMLNQATELTGLPAIAIEKDWWVTLCLKAVFSAPYSKHIIFKGGTSLSKAWHLIERFSEDIDLAIDRRLFGFEGDISKTQITKLRKKSCVFISNDFLKDRTRIFTDWGAIAECKLSAQPVIDSDKDPQVIEIHYDSVADTSEYLPQRVLIEASSRSLMEPVAMREINSILSMNLPGQVFSSEPFFAPAVLPQRTFLEKIFLLHEEFHKSTGKVRVDRLSRHLYDLERMMDGEYGKSALLDKVLYRNIVNHRKKFNPVKGVDYSDHTPGKIRIMPPDIAMREFAQDYSEMTRFMIYGRSLSFQRLMDRMAELQERINTTE
jgi:hypothetical protein